jgi:hypothetical protein
MARRLTREELLPALRAWAYLSGHGGELAGSLPDALGWLRSAVGGGPRRAARSTSCTTSACCSRGSRLPRSPRADDLGAWPEDERAARLAYEDRVLGPWALDPSVGDAHVAIAARSATSCARGRSPTRSAWPSGQPRGRAGLRRRATRRSCARAGARPSRCSPPGPPNFGTGAPPVDPAWRDWALEQRARASSPSSPRGSATAGCSRREDLWELRHLADLPSESTRLALRELHAAPPRSAAVGPQRGPAGPPAGPGGRRRRRRRQPLSRGRLRRVQHPRPLREPGPQRGRLRRRGRDDARDELGAIDLFDVRYAQGELLFLHERREPALRSTAQRRPRDRRARSSSATSTPSWPRRPSCSSTPPPCACNPTCCRSSDPQRRRAAPALAHRHRRRPRGRRGGGSA